MRQQKRRNISFYKGYKGYKDFYPSQRAIFQYITKGVVTQKSPKGNPEIPKR